MICTTNTTVSAYGGTANVEPGYAIHDTAVWYLHKSLPPPCLCCAVDGIATFCVFVTAGNGKSSTCTASRHLFRCTAAVPSLAVILDDDVDYAATYKLLTAVPCTQPDVSRVVCVTRNDITTAFEKLLRVPVRQTGSTICRPPSRMYVNKYFVTF